MHVYNGSDSHADLPGAFRVRAIPPDAIGAPCGYAPCDELALYYCETRDHQRYKGRRACTEHAERWWQHRTEEPAMSKSKAAEARRPGRPKLTEKRERLHFTLGGLALETLKSFEEQAAADGLEFNASRFVDQAICFAMSQDKFRALAEPAAGGFMAPKKAAAPAPRRRARA